MKVSYLDSKQEIRKGLKMKKSKPLRKKRLTIE